MGDGQVGIQIQKEALHDNKEMHNDIKTTTKDSRNQKETQNYHREDAKCPETPNNNKEL